jgi:Tfp pilus assembly protein PilN
LAKATSDDLLIENKKIKEISQQIQEDKRIISTLINTLPDSVYIKDKSSRFILANQKTIDKF